MTLEHRIRDALRDLDQVEPSIDLWARVSESIEADEERRRRLRMRLAAIVGVLMSFVALGWLATTETTLGFPAVDWRVMELMETGALVMLVLLLGPAVRRFGDGYAGEVFRANPETGASFLRLLDVAYYLVFGGYVLSTLEHEPPRLMLETLGNQLDSAASRVGGLLLVMGLLHAVTFLVLPLVGLVFTAAWRGRTLPKWVYVLLAVIALPVGVALLLVLPLGL